MITKLDYIIGGFAGFFTGIFLIPTLYNLGIREQFILIAVPAGVAVLWAFGVWFGKFLSRWIPVMAQFAKFAAVGFLNTAIDFGILNMLSASIGVTAGFIVGGVNIPGFLIAISNSYVWNKLWVFKDKNVGENFFQDAPKFILVTGIGLILNSGIVIVLTTFFTPFSGLSPEAWLNAAKVGATAVTFIWNFVGYKFIVFRTN